MLTNERLTTLTQGRGRRFRICLTEGRAFSGELFNFQSTDGPTTFMFRKIEPILPIGPTLPSDHFVFANENELIDVEVLIA